MESTPAQIKIKAFRTDTQKTRFGESIDRRN